jgi:hypothetical protein
MPKIPVYTPQQSIPATAGGVRVDVGEAGAPGRALMQQGQALQKVGAEMGDLAGVMEWRQQKIEKENAERNVFGEVIKADDKIQNKLDTEYKLRTGQEAALAYPEFEEWLHKEVATQRDGLKSDYEKNLFDVKVHGVVRQAKNEASGYSAVQRKAWNANLEDAGFTNILKGVSKSRGDDATASSAKQRVREMYETLYPGQNKSSEILIRSMKIDEAADDAKAKYAETNAFMDVMVRNGNDARKALDEWMKPETVTKYGLTDVQWRSGEQNFANMIRVQKDKDDETASKQEFSLLESYNKRSLTFDAVIKASGSIQDPQVRAKFQQKWQGMIDRQINDARSIRAAEVSASSAARSAAAAERASNPFLRGNPAIESKYIEKSLTAPWAIDRTELATLHGSGISTKAYENILNNIKQGEKGIWQTPNGKLVHATLKESRKNSVFSADAGKNAEGFNVEYEYFSNWIKKNPDATAKQLNEEMAARMAEYKKSRVKKWLEEMAR